MIHSTSVFGTVSILLGLYFAWKLPRGSVPAYFKKSEASFTEWFYFGLAALSFNLGATTLLSRLFPSLASPESHELMDLMNDGLGKIIVLTLTLLFAPLFEELFFRGLLIDGFEALVNQKRITAILASALLFALCHGLTQIPGVFLFAFFLGALRVRSISLWPTVWIHALNNAFGMAVIFYPVLRPTYLIAGLCLAVGCACAWRINRHLLRPSPTPP